MMSEECSVVILPADRFSMDGKPWACGRCGAVEHCKSRQNVNEPIERRSGCGPYFMLPQLLRAYADFGCQTTVQQALQHGACMPGVDFRCRSSAETLTH